MDQIIKVYMNNFRNAEHIQFMKSSYAIFNQYNINPELFGECYIEMARCCTVEETALAVERNKEKVREKNEADDYRDKLYSKLLSYVKSITYDKLDKNYDNACTVMAVIKEVGNPTHLAENAESAVITTLLRRFDAFADAVVAIGAGDTVRALSSANTNFIELEKECREITALQQVSGIPSVAVARKQSDVAYRVAVNAINGYAGINSKKEICKKAIAEMNTLIAKYNALVDGRSNSDEDRKENTDK